MSNYNSNISENRNLIHYFLLAFSISWVIWIPFAIFPFLLSFSMFGIMIGAFGPFIAAVVLSFRNKNIEGVKNLLKRGIDYKIRPIWYLLMFFLYPLCLVGALLILAMTGFIPTINNILNAIIMFLLFPYMLVVGGPLGEEFGWRGFALDRLQTKSNSLISSIILGCIWWAWHLPLFFIPESSQNILLVYFPVIAILYFAQIILITIIMTWLHNHINGSVLGAMIIHSMWNCTAAALTFATGVTNISDITPYNVTIATNTTIFYIGFLFLAVILIIGRYGVNLKK